MNKLKFKLILLIIIPIMGLIAVLFGSMSEMAKTNRNNEREITNLKTQLQAAEEELKINRAELKRIELLRYQNKVMQKKYPNFSKIISLVHKKSFKYGFNPDLILSIIQVESSFNPYAVSSQGAYGLMQINYSVWKKELSIDYKKIFNMDYNIELGLKILKHYYDYSGGNLPEALYLYNNGFKNKNHSYKNKVINTIFY